MSDYRYAAAGSGPHGRWPGETRLAVYVAVGVEDYTDDEGHTEDLLAGIPAPDRVNRAWRDYGNRVGAFRLLDRLRSLEIPPTVLLNTMVYDTAPAVVTAARAAGAEIVAHGVTNSDSLAGMSADAERAYLRKVRDRIATEENDAPRGWSSPWLAHTENTLDLLAVTGYDYLLDLRVDDRPVWLPTAHGSLLSIPYALELNDSTSMIGRQIGPGEFADMIVAEFDELCETPGEEPLVMSVVLHSFISGVPFRLRAVSQALAHIAARHRGVWLTQPRHIHTAFASHWPSGSHERASDGGPPRSAANRSQNSSATA